MHSLAGQGVEIGCQGGHQGLALTGAHLGDLALVEGHAANHLHIKMAQAQGATGGLPHGGKGLRQQLVEGCTLLQALAEFAGFVQQLAIVEPLHCFFEFIDQLDVFAHALENALVFAAEHRFDDFGNHGRPFCVVVITMMDKSGKPG